MSLPKIPDLNSQVDFDREKALNLILASIGMEEIGLSHIINVEGEKIQYLLGTLLDGDGNPIPQPRGVRVEDLLNTNKALNLTLKNVIRNQLLLQLKLEELKEFLPEKNIK